MKNKVLVVFLALVLVVSLATFAACKAEEEPPVVEEEEPPVVEEEEPPVVEEVWEWPEKLLIGVISTTSSGFASGIAWTTPLHKDTGMTIRLVCEQDPQLKGLWVNQGRFFATSPHQPRSGLYATKGFARRDWGPWQSRIWHVMGESFNSYAVLGDSGIKTPHDIKPGMKIMQVPWSQELVQMMYALLAWGQVDPEDVVWISAANTGQLGRMLLDGKGDVTIGWPTSSYWYEVAASPHGLTWIELDAEKDPEGAQRFLKKYPFQGFAICPREYPGAKDTWMMNSIAPYLTSVNTDPELVYRLVKWLDENYDSYKDGHPWCEDMTMDKLVELAEVHYEPLHDGSVRYLEEKGLWTEELEARRQYNIELLTLWIDSYQGALDQADDRGISVEPDNEEWLELWTNYKRDHNLPLLVMYQGPGKEQPSYFDFYQE